MKLSWRPMLAISILIVGVSVLALVRESAMRTSAQRASEIKTFCSTQAGIDKRNCYSEEIAKSLPDISKTIEVIDTLSTEGDLKLFCHYALHPVGEAAYRIYADTHNSDFMVANAALCNYGFYHGFIIALLEDQGNVTLAKDFCESLRIALIAERPEIQDQCYHGIGHALIYEQLDAKGVETDAEHAKPAMLAAARNTTALCDKLNVNIEKRNNCLSGLFHDLALLQTEEGWYTDTKDPFWLCFEFEGQYRSSCLGNWHRVFFKVFPTVTGEKLLPLVLSLYSDTLAVNDTVYWFGYTGTKQTQPALIDQQCRLLPQTYQLTCLLGAVAKTMENGTRGSEYKEGLAFCSLPDFSKEERSACGEKVLNYIQGIYAHGKVVSICIENKDLFANCKN